MIHQFNHSLHPLILISSFCNDSNTQNPLENGFDRLLIYVTLIALWLLFLVIFVILKSFESEELSHIKQIFDGCSQNDAFFKYFIKLKIGWASQNYQRKKASIMIDFLDTKKRFVTRIAISPTWITKEIPKQHEESFQFVKILLYRSVEISNIGFIRINHDSYYPLGGLLYVHSLTFRNFAQNSITLVPISSELKPCLPDDSPDDHIYKANKPEFCRNYHETYLDQKSPYISKNECLLFYFAYCNISLFINSLVFTINPVTCSFLSYYYGVINFCIAFAITFFFLISFRLLIKRNYSLSRGAKPWSLIRKIFIYTLLINSCLIGLMSIFVEVHLKTQSFFLWITSLLTSYILFAFLTLILIAFNLFFCYKKS